MNTTSASLSPKPALTNEQTPAAAVNIDYCLYVLYRVNVSLHQLHYHYRQRFEIESTYRIKNQCRIRTTSKKPFLRLLFMAVVSILINLWIYLLWHFVSRSRPGGRRVFRSIFSLQSMLGLIAHAVERHFLVIYLPLTS
jgi:putative transposase